MIVSKISRRGSQLALSALLFAAACSGPSTSNFFDSPASAGASSAAAAGDASAGQGVGAAAGASSSSSAGTAQTSGGSTAGGKKGMHEGGVNGDAGKSTHGDSAGADAASGSGGLSGGSAGASGNVATSGSAGAAGTSGGASTAGSAGSAGISGASAGTAGAGTAGTAGSVGNGGGSGDPLVQLDGTATASSWENDFGPGGGIHPPRHANDGDPTTRWCAAAQTLPQWWQLDLGDSHPLSRVEIVWENPAQASGHPYGYKIGVADDATQFPSVPAIDNTSNQSTMKTQVATFAPQTAGRYVRITVTSLPPDTKDFPPLETWASIVEVRVFGH